MLSILSYIFWDVSQLAVKCRGPKNWTFICWFWNFRRFELSRVSLSHGSQYWFDLSEVSRNRRFEKLGIREIEGEIIELERKQIQGKQGLVRDIGRFGKPRVREIGLPRYCTTSECLDWLYRAISHEIDDNRFLSHFSRESMLFTSWYDVSHAMGFRVGGEIQLKITHSLC